MSLRHLKLVADSVAHATETVHRVRMRCGLRVVCQGSAVALAICFRGWSQAGVDS